MSAVHAAFVQAQRNFAPALKKSDNPYFGSKYADLANCIEAVIDALHENGIALTQLTKISEKGVIVSTVFLHESGDHFDAGEIFVPAAQTNAQAFGSALTYARRYSLMTACGIAPEDDDGNAASKPQAPKILKPEQPAQEYDYWTTKHGDVPSYATVGEAEMAGTPSFGSSTDKAGDDALNEVPNCKHGAMAWKTGKKKTGGDWYAYQCTYAYSPGGGEARCNAIWYVLSADGKFRPQDQK